MRNRRKLLEVVKDDNATCLDRGDAVVELIRGGMKQDEVARLTSLSSSMVSHLKKIFLHLEGTARDISHERKINVDACYLLASVPAALDQEKILADAIQLCKERDDRRAAQKLGVKGRQSQKGQITHKEIRTAIRHAKHGSNPEPSMSSLSTAPQH
jgi:hypothetical protein